MSTEEKQQGEIRKQVTKILDLVRNLNSRDLEGFIQQQQADDKALQLIFRAVLAREREIHRQTATLEN